MKRNLSKLLPSATALGMLKTAVAATRMAGRQTMEKLSWPLMKTK